MGVGQRVLLAGGALAQRRHLAQRQRPARGAVGAEVPRRLPLDRSSRARFESRSCRSVDDCDSPWNAERAENARTGRRARAENAGRRSTRHGTRLLSRRAARRIEREGTGPLSLTDAPSSAGDGRRDAAVLRPVPPLPGLPVERCRGEARLAQQAGCALPPRVGRSRGNARPQLTPGFRAARAQAATWGSGAGAGSSSPITTCSTSRARRTASRAAASHSRRWRSSSTSRGAPRSRASSSCSTRTTSATTCSPRTGRRTWTSGWSRSSGRSTARSRCAHL